MSRATFFSCCRGVAAIEMALIAPIFVLVIIGGVTVFDMLRAQRDVSHATNAIVDAVAHYKSIQADDMTTLMGLSEAILPTRYGRVATRITQITKRDGADSVYWSEVNYSSDAEEYGWAPMDESMLSSMDYPEFPDYTFLLIVEMKFSYEPLFSIFDPFEISFVSFRRPVLRDLIEYYE